MNFKQKRKEKLKFVCALCELPIQDEAEEMGDERFCSCKKEPEFAPANDSNSKREQEKTEIHLPENYSIQSLIGAGGMGSVYKVYDEVLKQSFAVKKLRPELVEDSTSLARFASEVEASIKLTHPNLVSVYKHGLTKDGAPYLVMDYIEGTSLATLLKEKKRLELHQALGIFIQVCSALAHSHMKGIVHRDLKPSNILITHSKEGLDLVKLVDFGIAKTISNGETRESRHLTSTGDIVGTPLYMSPEQCMGFKLDERSDIYSLGCLIYEALTGTPPFVGENPIQVIVQQLTSCPPDISSDKNNCFDENLACLVEKALAKDPNDRFQNMDEMRIALEKIAEGKPLKKLIWRRKSRRIPKPALYAGLIAMHALLLLPLVVRPPQSITFYWNNMGGNRLASDAVSAHKALQAFANGHDYKSARTLYSDKGELTSVSLEFFAPKTGKNIEELRTFLSREDKLLGDGYETLIKALPNKNAKFAEIDAQLTKNEANLSGLATKIDAQSIEEKKFERYYDLFGNLYSFGYLGYGTLLLLLDWVLVIFFLTKFIRRKRAAKSRLQIGVFD